MNFFTKKLSFEFSTTKIKIVENNKLIHTENSLVKIDKEGNVVSIGNNVNVKDENNTLNPLKGGIIADFYAFERLLRHSISQSDKKRKPSFIKPSLIILAIIPDACTEVEIRSVRDAFEHAGGREVYMIYSSLAIAKGANFDSSKTYIIIDAGAAKVSISIFKNNRIYYPKQIGFGAQNIKQYLEVILKNKYNVLCTNSVIEDILHNYLSYGTTPKLDFLRIAGVNPNGTKVSIQLDLKYINNSIQSYLKIIQNELQIAINEYLTNESKIIDYIMLTGGFSKLTGFDSLVSELNNFPLIKMSEKDTVLEGLKRFDSNFKENKYALR